MIEYWKKSLRSVIVAATPNSPHSAGLLRATICTAEGQVTDGESILWILCRDVANCANNSNTQKVMSANVVTTHFLFFNHTDINHDHVLITSVNRFIE